MNEAIYQTPGAPTDAELLAEARKIVCRERRGSISSVQRHLGIGYNRAALLLEMLERDGVLSPINGKGGRTLL